MNDPTNWFISAASLLMEQKASIASLATAVEQGGVWVWDRFDRLVKVAPKSAEAAQTLVDLEKRCKIETEAARHPDRYGGEIYDPEDDPLAYFGWKEDDLPDFAALEADRPVAALPVRSSSRVEDSLRHMVGALLLMVEGGEGWQPHPEFKNQTKLIADIADKLGDYPGLSQRNMEKWFPEARNAILRPTRK